jgi:mercuric ion transport protein
MSARDGSIARQAAQPARRRGVEIATAYLSLFASLGTLFCCALPALLVLIGFSLSGVLTFFTAIPGWQNFGQYDKLLFPLCGVLLASGFYFAYFQRSATAAETCEVPTTGGESACSTATRWNRRILWLSLFLFIVALVMVPGHGIIWMRSHGYFNH